jgi:hypothetical protein
VAARPAVTPCALLTKATGPFLGLGPLLPAQVVPNVVLVPRSTARIHTPADRERIAWESHGLLTAAEHGGRIAAISTYMRAHLSIDYQVPSHALVELPNGLSPTDWQLTPPPHGLLPHLVRDGFLLAMGGAQPYKGFDDLLDALVILHQQEVAVPHLVLAAVTDNPEPDDYQQHLAKKITSEGLDVTLLTRFHPDIRRLLTHPALRGVTSWWCWDAVGCGVTEAGVCESYVGAAAVAGGSVVCGCGGVRGQASGGRAGGYGVFHRGSAAACAGVPGRGAQR